MLGTVYLLLVANLLNNVMFGAYVPMAVECVRMTIRKYRNTGRINKVLLSCFFLITLIATAKFSIDNGAIVRAFTSPTPDGQPKYHSFTSPIGIAASTLWVLQMMIADAFIVYRVWVVWWPNWRVAIIPVLISLASLGLAGYIFNLFAEESVLVRRNDALRAFFSTALSLNVICTGLIAFRVWSIRRRIRMITVPTDTNAPNISRKDPINNAVAIIVESALIYSLFLILDLIFIALKSPLSYLFHSMLPQVIPLVFGSMIIRSAQGHCVEDATLGSDEPTVSRTMPFFASQPSGSTSRAEGIQVELDGFVASQVTYNGECGRNNVSPGKGETGPGSSRKSLHSAIHRGKNTESQYDPFSA